MLFLAAAPTRRAGGERRVLVPRGSGRRHRGRDRAPVPRRSAAAARRSRARLRPARRPRAGRRRPRCVACVAAQAVLTAAGIGVAKLSGATAVVVTVATVAVRRRGARSSRSPRRVAWTPEQYAGSRGDLGMIPSVASRRADRLGHASSSSGGDVLRVALHDDAVDDRVADREVRAHEPVEVEREDVGAVRRSSGSTSRAESCVAMRDVTAVVEVLRLRQARERVEQCRREREAVRG